MKFIYLSLFLCLFFVSTHQKHIRAHQSMESTLEVTLNSGLASQTIENDMQTYDGISSDVTTAYSSS